MKVLLTAIISIFLNGAAIAGDVINRVENIKIDRREGYDRLIFELPEKPNYSVAEENKIITIKLKNSSIDIMLNNVVESSSTVERSDVRIVEDFLQLQLTLKADASLKRYLYIAPDASSLKYRFIVDINTTLEKISSEAAALVPKKEVPKLLDDIIGDIVETQPPSKYQSEIDRYIAENIPLTNNTTDADYAPVAQNARPSSNYANMNDLLEKNIFNGAGTELDLNILINDIFESQSNQPAPIKTTAAEAPKQKPKTNDGTRIVQKTQSPSTEKRSNTEIAISNRNILKKNFYIIVIDAGHGGNDPGAIGKNKTKEKDVNLAFAKALKYELDKNQNYRVYLTRGVDKYIQLSERVRIAKRLNADLFISLHADASTNTNARGASIYTLSTQASDTRTAALAKKENKADILGGMNLFGEYQDTVNTLLDLSRRNQLNNSNLFAKKIVNSFKSSSIRTLGTPHKYGNFAVLLSPDFPSVLIELGFLTNSEDEKMLRSWNYRKRVVDALTRAIGEHFKR